MYHPYAEFDRKGILYRKQASQLPRGELFVKQSNWSVKTEVCVAPIHHEREMARPRVAGQACDDTVAEGCAPRRAHAAGADPWHVPQQGCTSWQMSFVILAALVTPASSLRVVSYNIHGWRTVEHECSMRELIELLQEAKPDVLCLNEVLHPFCEPDPLDCYWRVVQDGRGHTLAPPEGSGPTDRQSTCLMQLSEALGLGHLAFGAATTEAGYFGSHPFGNCILSRYEIADCHHAVLRVNEADLTLGGQTRTVHDLSDRSLTTARISIPGVGHLGFAVTHLDHKAEELRERQIKEAIDYCESVSFDDGLPYLLMGDLNSFDRADLSDDGWAAICALYESRGWPPPRAQSLVQGALRDAGFADAFALQEASHDPLPPPTCWTNTRLDYLMLSESAQELIRTKGSAQPCRLRVRSHETLPWAASDHLPIVCDFIIDGGPEAATERGG
jgi:endonuclease/exonuclease/phosphatase family metal-dependent hydrolase